MITSLHNSIHLTEMVTILLRRCVCPSGRIINIKINANTHSSHPTVCICQRATASATTTATTINCVIPHMQPYHPMESMSTYNYIYRPDDSHSAQPGNATRTAAVSNDDLHALGPVCTLVIPLKGHQMVLSQLGKCVHHIGGQKGTDVLWNKSAISGAVLKPVRAVAHAATAA